MLFCAELAFAAEQVKAGLYPVPPLLAVSVLHTRRNGFLFWFRSVLIFIAVTGIFCLTPSSLRGIFIVRDGHPSAVVGSSSDVGYKRPAGTCNSWFRKRRKLRTRKYSSPQSGREYQVGIRH